MFSDSASPNISEESTTSRSPSEKQPRGTSGANSPSFGRYVPATSKSSASVSGGLLSKYSSHVGMLARQTHAELRTLTRTSFCDTCHAIYTLNSGTQRHRSWSLRLTSPPILAGLTRGTSGSEKIAPSPGNARRKIELDHRADNLKVEGRRNLRSDHEKNRSLDQVHQADRPPDRKVLVVIPNNRDPLTHNVLL